MTKSELTNKIKYRASELGFLACGISKAEFLSKEAGHLEKWLSKGMHGKMSYMENHFEKRVNPTLLVNGAKSVVSVLLNYYPKEDLFENADLKISKYAYGQDYHIVIRDKLNTLIDFIKAITGDLSIRAFTDSAPVLEKAWAERAGLGWIGKNGNLITQRVGSFYFLGEIILDCELDYDLPATDHCGSCRRCIDACPTEAIVKPYVVDGSKCISYLTIELKDEIIPTQFTNKMGNWIFGCDICQDVCPWNKFSSPTNEPLFEPLSGISQKEIIHLSDEQFNTVFKYSAIKRTKASGLRRNILFVNSQKK